MTGNLGLRLVQDVNNNGTLDQGEVLAEGNSPGTANELVSRTLNAGVNYIQVYSTTGPLNSSTEHIGLRDLNDFYRFSPSAARTVSVSLVGFAGLFRFLDADLRLHRDANNNGSAEDNEALASSMRTGVGTESLSQALSAGTYFVRIDALKTQTSTVFLDNNYLLSLS